MKSLWKCLIQSALTIGISTGSMVVVNAQDADQAGIVRISKPRIDRIMDGQVMPAAAMMSNEACVPPVASPGAFAGCNSGGSGGYNPAAAGMMSGPASACDSGNGHGCPRSIRRGFRSEDFQSNPTWGQSRHARCQTDGNGIHNPYHGSMGAGGGPLCQNDHSHGAMMEYLKCKFGYFIPSGGAGRGIPWAGKYARVYPVNPAYSDPRDGQTWAAQGYGIPMAVPLAPVVGHTYDYGWGVPSSRLTPVSNPAY